MSIPTSIRLLLVVPTSASSRLNSMRLVRFIDYRGIHDPFIGRCVGNIALCQSVVLQEVHLGLGAQIVDRLESRLVLLLDQQSAL